MAIHPDEARALLMKRLDELEQEDALGAQAAAPVALEQDSVGRLSRVDALQSQAMALASQRRRQSEKSQIAAALRKISKDEYGYCLSCGKEIGDARLRSSPAAAQCIYCAA